jgi:hypothetical protein
MVVEDVRTGSGAKMTDDDKKDKWISDMLSDKGLREGEGKQRLAWAMCAPLRHNISGQAQEEFVYKKPEDGWRELAQANYLRRMANDPGVSPSMADMYERMAKSWDEYAKVPKWKRVLIEWFSKHFG